MQTENYSLKPRQKLKYQLYEESVQSTETQIDFFESAYKELNRGKKPKVLREDFCGTFAITCDWVKKNPERSGLVLDLDPEPLTYGKKYNLSKLSKEQQKRIQILQQDVISVPRTKADIIAACNFSFYIFKQREMMIKYFKKALQGLNKGGVFLLEAVGGPGMVEEEKEKTKHKKKGKHWFTYVWDQKKYDPVTGDVLYSISFKFPDGKKMKDAFVYDWRLWTIPELRECLKEAGFSKTAVFWEESDDDDEGTGYYYRTETGDNDHVWVTYVVGQK